LNAAPGQAIEQAPQAGGRSASVCAVSPADVAELSRAFAPDALDQRMNAIAIRSTHCPPMRWNGAQQHDPLNFMNARKRRCAAACRRAGGVCRCGRLVHSWRWTML